MLVSIVPWIIDTRSFNYALIKTVFSNLIIFTIAAVWLFKILEEGRFNITKSPLNIPILVFWAWCVVTSLISPYKYASFEELFRLSSYFLLFFIILNNIKEKGQVERIITTLMITAGITAIYAIFQHFGLDFINWPRQTRSMSSFGNPDFYSGFLCVTIPVCVGMLFAAKSVYARILYCILAVLQAAGLYYTLTRGGWAAIPIAIILFFVLKLSVVGIKNFFSNKRYVISSVLALVLFVVFSVSILSHRSLQQTRSRLTSLFSFVGELARETPHFLTFLKPYPDLVDSDWIVGGGNYGILEKNGIYKTKIEGTAGVRVTLWHGTWRMILENPVVAIVGHGLGVYHQVFPKFRPPYYRFKTVWYNNTHAHSEYFEIMSEQGFIGLILFLWIFAVFFRKKTYQSEITDPWKQNLLFGLLSGVFAVLFENLGSVNLRWIHCAFFFWISIGLACVISRKSEVVAPTQAQQKKTEIRKQVPGPVIKTIGYICAIILLIFLYTQTLKSFSADIHQNQGVLGGDMKGDWDKAISEYDKALHFKPINVDVLYKLAFAYAKKGEFDRSVETYLSVIRSAPDYYQVHHNLGYIYYYIGKIDDAVKELEKSVKLDWSDDQSFYLLGLCYESKGDIERAVKAFEDAVVARKEVYTYLNNAINPCYIEAALKLGNSYIKVGKIAEAAVQFKEVLKADPKNSEAITGLRKTATNHH